MTNYMILHLTVNQLEIGDRITGFKQHWAEPWADTYYAAPVDWRVTGIEADCVVATDVNSDASGFHSSREFNVDAMAFRFKVLRSEAKANAGRWNGICADCKLGTYTGMFQVEHEGGSCMGKT